MHIPDDFINGLIPPFGLVPLVPVIISAIVTGLGALGSWLTTAFQAIQSVPWKRVFTWALLGVFIVYFSQVTWFCFSQAFRCLRTVFDSPNVLNTPSPLGVFTQVVTFSEFWKNLQNLVPEFWRWFLWYMGSDWLFMVFASGVHFWIIGSILDSYAKPIAVFIHRVIDSL